MSKPTNKFMIQVVFDDGARLKIESQPGISRQQVIAALDEYVVRLKNAEAKREAHIHGNE